MLSTKFGFKIINLGHRTKNIQISIKGNQNVGNVHNRECMPLPGPPAENDPPPPISTCNIHYTYSLLITWWAKKKKKPRVAYPFKTICGSNLTLQPEEQLLPLLPSLDASLQEFQMQVQYECSVSSEKRSLTCKMKSKDRAQLSTNQRIRLTSILSSNIDRFWLLWTRHFWKIR